MKKILVLLVLMSGFSAKAYDSAAVADAQKELTKVKERFEVGEVTKVDIAQAEKFLLDMRFLAGQVSKGDYCAVAVDLQHGIAENTELEARVGARPLTDVYNEKREFHRLRGLCHKP